jgi:hypothetical protein
MRPMLRSFLLGLFFACFAVRSFGLIGIGYSHRNVRFWRFWDMKDGGGTPHILVYNTGDSAVTFTMHSVYVEDEVRADTARLRRIRELQAECAKDTLVSSSVVPPHSYRVFVIHDPVQRTGYQGAFINGQFAGMAGKLGAVAPSVVAELPYRYLSYESQYGTPAYGLIATNDLVLKKGQHTHFRILYDFADKQRWQFFTGINKISVDMSKGVDAVTMMLDHVEYEIRNDKGPKTFSVDMRTGRSYTSDIDVSMANNDVFPTVDLSYYFANGNAGNELPIFAE